MKYLSIPIKASMALLTIIVMTACVPGEPTPSPDEIAAAIETAVAETVEAQGQVATSVALTVAGREAEAAATASAMAAAEPTFTATPVPTLTPVLATATSVIISGGGSGSGGSSSGGGGGTTSYAYHCDPDIRKRPLDNTEFRRNETFDVTFAILNNGTATWEKGKDLYLLEDHGVLTTPFTMLELPVDLKPGEVWEIGYYDAVAPDEPGHYVIDFKLEGGFCYPYVAFDVVR